MNIEFDDKEIDVKDIMHQIKENLAKRNFKDDLLALKDEKETKLDFGDLENHQYILNRSWHYSADYQITSHRKFIGPFIVFGKKLVRKFLRWYINPVVNNQVEFNANIVRMTNDLLKLLKNIENRIYEIENQLRQKENIKDKNDIQSQIDEIKEKVVSLQMFHELKQQEQNENVVKLKEEVEHIVNNLKSEILSINRTIRVATERLRRIERNIRNSSNNDKEYGEKYGEKKNNDIISFRNHEKKESNMDFDYYLFEELYRGPRETIKEKQKQYLKYFENGEHVLDLGCGRGEFTELLLEKGINVTAVDLNDDMVAYCRERGFPVIKSDILEYLKNIEDNSVDGIFLGQVIEHLKPNELISLFYLAFNKLKPTGWFIAETPNPQTLSIFAQSFYMDLTHVKPVHPYTAKFLAESAGFSHVEIHYFSPNDEHLRLPQLKSEGFNSESLEAFNRAIEHWNNVVFGYQDYYIAARK